MSLVSRLNGSPSTPCLTGDGPNGIPFPQCSKSTSTQDHGFDRYLLEAYEFAFVESKREYGDTLSRMSAEEFGWDWLVPTGERVLLCLHQLHDLTDHSYTQRFLLLFNEGFGSSSEGR